MPVLDASFLTQRKWQALIGVLILIGLHFVFRPERDQTEVIREQLHAWAIGLEKKPAPPPSGEGNNGAHATSVATSAALLEEVGHVRRLINSAFTEDAQIRAVRGPREQGREAISKWCLALRHHAEQISITLENVVVHIDANAPENAEASLLVHLNVAYQGQRYTRNYECELQLKRDKTWRIAVLTARQTSSPQSTTTLDSD